MPDHFNVKEPDNEVLWFKGTPAVFRFRQWLCPVLTTAAILVLIIALGASHTKTSHRLWSAEQHISNLSVVIQSLNASLQQTQENFKKVQQLQFTVDNHKDQLTSVSEALKQLSVVESLSKRVALLRCSLNQVINNSSAVDGCCPLGWKQFDGNNCYLFSNLILSWNDSREWCKRHDSHLVILNTDQEWDFVTRETRPFMFWVGLSDWRTGEWEWVNHTPYTIERRHWMPGQPDSWTGHGLSGNEDCAHLSNNGQLNDLHCTKKMRYICQKHSVKGPSSLATPS